MKMLKIQSLDKGWCDKDHVMLHAAFQLLVDFVEKERPDQIVDWDSDPQHKHVWKEIRYLYKWWSEKRPSRKSPLDDKNLKKPPMRWKKISGSDCGQLVDWDKKKYFGDIQRSRKNFGVENFGKMDILSEQWETK